MGYGDNRESVEKVSATEVAALFVSTDTVCVFANSTDTGCQYYSGVRTLTNNTDTTCEQYWRRVSVLFMSYESM